VTPLAVHLRRRGRAVAALLALGVLTAACGGGGGGDSSSYKAPTGPAQQTAVIKAGNIYFDPKKVELPAGVDAIKLQGEGGLHTLVFDDKKFDGFKLEVTGSGSNDTKKIDLEPGKYTFYCDIPGHREAGMEGTLTVA
jgi:uncharacterized cupredoxin-like copper-binding protein